MSYGSFQKRVLIPVRQRPSSEDLNALQWERAASELIAAGTAYGQNVFSSPGSCVPSAMLGARGFSGGGFYVAVDSTAPPFGVTVQAGVGYNYVGPASATDIDSNQGADWVLNNSWAVPLVLSADQDFIVPAPPAVGSSRIDIIEVRADYLAADPQTVGIFDPGSSAFNPTVSNKSLSWDLAGRTGSVNAPSVSTACISYVKGQSAVGAITAATVPSTTSGYIKIAQINLDASGGAIAAVTEAMIADYRPLLFPQSTLCVGGRFTAAGVLGGLGSINFGSVEVPPGVHVVGLVQTGAAAPSVGSAYPVYVYIFGGDLRPRSAGLTPGFPEYRGAVSTSPSGNRYVAAGSVYGILDATEVSRLSGGAVGWSTYGSSVSGNYAYGQPYWRLTFQLGSPTAAALNNTESFYFNAMLNLG
jgi:hypothetical protein